MNCGLYLMIESDFVDNCLGEQSKTGPVVETDTKGQVEGDTHHLHGCKQTEETAPSLLTQPAAQRKDKADSIFYFTCAAL